MSLLKDIYALPDCPVSAYHLLFPVFVSVPFLSRPFFVL